MENVDPFLKMLDAEGLAIVALERNFAVQSFLSLDEKLVENLTPITAGEKFKAELTNYVAKDALAYWGGEDAEPQLKRMLEVLAGGDQNTLSVFNSIIQNYTEKYFGPDIGFNDDILTLLNNEFAFVIEQHEGENIYKVILELSDPQKDIVRIHEIANNFASIGAIFEPKVVEHILEDGTLGREIVAVPEEIVKNESKYEDSTIYELEMGKQDWGIYYTFVDDIAIISSNKAGVKYSIDIAKGKEESLKNSAAFNMSINPVLQSSDEITYFNFEKLIPVLFPEDDAPNIIKIISLFSSGKNYFNDGIVSINYLHIEKN